MGNNIYNNINVIVNKANIDEFRLRHKKPKSNPKTKVIDILTREKIKIGTLKWLGRWRKYCFFPESETVFESTCLFDINKVLLKLMEEYKGVKNENY